MSLKLSVDQYIEMFDRLSSSTKTEMEEQDAATGGSTGGGASPTKRFDISSPKRGPANQLGNTKWRDSYPLNRGVANTLF